MLSFFFVDDGRKLKHIINGLLKSGAATTVRRINYVQSYTLHDNKIHKQQEKIVQVEYTPENEKKVEAMLKKSEIKEWKIIKN